MRNEERVKKKRMSEGRKETRKKNGEETKEKEEGMKEGKRG